MLQGWWLWRITPTSSPGPGQSEVELGCRVSLILPGISASAAPGIHGTTLSSRGQNWLYNFKQDNHLSKAITSTCQEQLVKMAQKQWQECSEKFGPSIQLPHTAGKRHLLIKHQSNTVFFYSLCLSVLPLWSPLGAILQKDIKERNYSGRAIIFSCLKCTRYDWALQIQRELQSL